jgi:hypothetical protein
MNTHQQASTPHRHSSGKDIAWQQWHLIAIEGRLNLAKSHLIAIGNAQDRFFMITKVPHPIRVLSFRDHGPMPLIEGVRP